MDILYAEPAHVATMSAPGQISCRGSHQLDESPNQQRREADDLRRAAMFSRALTDSNYCLKRQYQGKEANRPCLLELSATVK
jgi:hypothetical protein